MKIFTKNIDTCHTPAQNVDCGYSLDGSNEYPQSMFWAEKIKKCLPLETPVLLYKSGV